MIHAAASLYMLCWLMSVNGAHHAGLVGAGGNAFHFPEQSYEVIHITETALLAHVGNIVTCIRQQLFGQLNPFPVDIFYRCYAKSFLEQLEKCIAAHVGFAAEFMHQYFFGQVLVNVVQHKLPAALVALVRLLQGFFEVLALYQSYHQLFQAQVGKDVFVGISAAANTHDFIEQVAQFFIIIEMILVELQLPVGGLFGIVVVKLLQVLQRVVHITAVYRQGYALGGIGIGSFGKIDHHGFVGRQQHRLTGQVVKRRSVVQVHHFFAPHHARQHHIAEGERHPVSFLVRFKNIEFAMLQVKDTPVLYQGL